MATLNWVPTCRTTCWTGADVEIPGGDRGLEPHPCPVPLASMPAGDTLSQTASNPPKQDKNPRCAA